MGYDFTENDFEFQETVDALVDFIRQNAPKTQMLNVQRYSEVCHAKRSLDRMLHRFGEHEAELELMPLYGAAVLRADVDELESRDVNDFIEAIKGASNFEIYQLANGKLRLGITFFGMMLKL